MKNLYGETVASLCEDLVEKGFKPFNAKQVFTWLYKKKVYDFAQYTDTSKALREHLSENYVIRHLPISERHVSKDGTKKYLLALPDGHLIETVLMVQDYGKTICVTSQVGCNLGCAFCASGLFEKVRDLTPAEMVLQIVAIEAREDVRVSHVVIMGTGEPFDNFDNVMRFIDIINSPYGMEIGARKITVSTAGLVPGILAFADLQKQVNLAVSLHAADDKTRTSLMPINRKYPIKRLMESLQTYIEKTNRRVTFEYLLIAGVNDSLHDADRLVGLLKDTLCYVNLIPFNEVAELDYKGSEEKQHARFYDRLVSQGIRATSRRELGADIDAACGQLRIKEECDNL